MSGVEMSPIHTYARFNTQLCGTAIVRVCVCNVNQKASHGKILRICNLNDTYSIYSLLEIVEVMHSLNTCAVTVAERLYLVCLFCEVKLTALNIYTEYVFFCTFSFKEIKAFRLLLSSENCNSCSQKVAAKINLL